MSSFSDTKVGYGGIRILIIKAIMTLFVLAALGASGSAMTTEQYSALSEYPVDSPPADEQPIEYPTADEYPMEYPTSYPEGSSEEYPEPGQAAYFTDQEPQGYGTLVDGGQAPPDYTDQILGEVPDGNGLWIADGEGNERLTTLSAPVESYSNQEIIPSVEGDLVVYHKYPSGEIHSYPMGHVYPHHRYWTWFYGPHPGRYEVWYTIGGRYYSNHVWFDLRWDWPWWYGGYTYSTYYYYYTTPVVYNPVIYEPIVCAPIVCDYLVFDP